MYYLRLIGCNGPSLTFHDFFAWYSVDFSCCAVFKKVSHFIFFSLPLPNQCKLIEIKYLKRHGLLPL